MRPFNVPSDRSAVVIQLPQYGSPLNAKGIPRMSHRGAAEGLTSVEEIAPFRGMAMGSIQCW